MALNRKQQSDATRLADGYARDIFDRAWAASRKQDGEAALEVCRRLEVIREHYQLWWRWPGDTRDLQEPIASAQPEQSTARPKYLGKRITAKFSGKCCVCQQTYAVGSEVYWNRGKGGTACSECGSES